MHFVYFIQILIISAIIYLLQLKYFYSKQSSYDGQFFRFNCITLMNLTILIMVLRDALYLHSTTALLYGLVYKF